MGKSLLEPTVELLQQMIRNGCVNDGSVESGQEIKNCELLEAYLDLPNVEITTFEPEPGRKSMVAKLAGSDPSAKSLCLMGHTDVVPVSPDGWHNDPFGGELIDGEVWGRGAVDMLNLTSSMAVAFREFAVRDQPLAGDLLFFGVADEEAGGTYGAEHIIANNWTDVAADFVLTEYGGLQSKNEDGLWVLINSAEKGVNWRTITITGTPGHGSRPYKADNALVTAAEVVARLHAYAPEAQIDDQWKQRVDSLELPAATRQKLKDRSSIEDALAEIDVDEAKLLHACSHTTFSPNTAKGGTKANVIPDQVTLQIDIRALPGETLEDIETHLQNALGDLYDRVEMENLVDPLLASGGTLASSTAAEGALWNAVEKSVKKAVPEAKVFSGLVTGGTDARFYRSKGSAVFGAGLLSPDIEVGEFFSRFHGYNERIDLKSLELTSDLWMNVITEINQAD